MFSCFTLFAIGCDRDSGPSHDFSTPEGTILKFEDALRAKDIDAAVACKDFKRLAELSTPNPADPNAMTKMTQFFELGFRQQIRMNGFPEMKGVKTTFTAKRDAGNGMLVLTEVWRHPDGKQTTQEIQVCKNGTEWRVIGPVENASR